MWIGLQHTLTGYNNTHPCSLTCPGKEIKTRHSTFSSSFMLVPQHPPATTTFLGLFLSHYTLHTLSYQQRTIAMCQETLNLGKMTIPIQIYLHFYEAVTLLLCLLFTKFVITHYFDFPANKHYQIFISLRTHHGPGAYVGFLSKNMLLISTKYIRIVVIQVSSKNLMMISSFLGNKLHPLIHPSRNSWARIEDKASLLGTRRSKSVKGTASSIRWTPSLAREHSEPQRVIITTTVEPSISGVAKVISTLEALSSR